MLAKSVFADPVLDADAAVFRENFDRHSFAFKHRLAGHPLFEFDRLLTLAKKMAQTPGAVYYDAGDIKIDQRWDQTPVGDLPIDELLHRIETAGAWVILRRAEIDPEYAALLDECIAEIGEMSGLDLGKMMKLRNAIIFVNSPNRVSTYHIDRECNCLLQLRGTKELHVFDREDREVLPEEEIERFWAVDNNAAQYKPHLENRARVYQLVPGSAVHIPVNNPHWVLNGPEVSVSISVNFHYRDTYLADLYRANYYLRRVGLKPMPPKRSTLVDNLKRTTFGLAKGLRQTVGRPMRNG
ncbi:MAG: transcriptional regulator [Vulcanimicrobiaceae bacterium]